MLPPNGDIDVLPRSTLTKRPAKAHADSKVPANTNGQSISQVDLPRAASYTSIPTVTEPPSESRIKRTFSENVLAISEDVNPQRSGANYAPRKEILRQSSQKAKQKRAESVSSSKLKKDGKQQTPNGVAKSPANDKTETSKSGSRSVSGTIRRLARKSWLSPSRSPSPTKEDKEVKRREKMKRKSFSKSTSELVPQPSLGDGAPELPEPVPSDPPAAPRPSPPKRSGTMPSSGRRPLSAIISMNKTDSGWEIPRPPSVQSLRSLRSKHSSESLVMGKNMARMPSVKVPPLPTGAVSDKGSSLSVDVARKKDPLWGAFRSLEGDYQKFHSKSSALKANVLRTTLLPFLSRNAKHPSNQSLRAEDLDRRVMILNKWWTGLLEMLHGQSSQNISGTDRPAFLESVTGIMTRPEWRVPPFPTSPGSTPQPRRPALTSRSTTSVESSNSDFLTDTIHHNVRNMFIENLLSQMSFAVEKMSMRSAPASLVAFCGKVCAYAFVFCPGVADILMRLWSLSPIALKRAQAEFEMPRATNLSEISKDVAGHFPPNLRSLSFTTHTALVRRLRQHSPLPKGTAEIPWYGPWTARWAGRDSDLFFVFVKHFYTLIVEFLPEHVPQKHRLCVPGLVPVQAQILVVLESTLYRQANQQPSPETYASSMFEELENPDAPAATMPLTSANAARSMAENRLIMVLRDILADTSPELFQLREIYAESFGSVVKAAARKISLYDGNACFVLCDFMEELLAIMFRYHQKVPTQQVLDWSFWLKVCQAMMQSHNSLTEVRLLAFVYSTWNIIIGNEERRRMFCLDWLLDEKFFEKHFNHWCPMVRGYYQRLLCWRMARSDGDASEFDVEIYETLLRRLNTTWAHYQFLRDDAESREALPPSTAPCSPAPGRRIVIIRNDSMALSGNFLLPFDHPIGAPSSIQDGPYNSHSSALNAIPAADSPSQTKKRWSLFKNIIPFSSPGNARPGEVTPPNSASEDSPSPLLDEQHLKDISGQKTPTHSGRSRPPTPTHQAFSFKFSLEWLEHPAWPSKNRRLFPPKLPPPAQAALQSRNLSVVTEVVGPNRPDSSDSSTAKYAGRSLAEWAQLVSECQGFVERRFQEGVPHLKLIEVPTLGVESFRVAG